MEVSLLLLAYSYKHPFSMKQSLRASFIPTGNSCISIFFCGCHGQEVSYLLRQRPTKGLCCVSTSSYYGNICLTRAHTHICHTCFILISSLRVCSSFRRSFLLPTRMMGTLGQKCFTSGVHFSGIFSGKCQEKKTNET